MGKYSVRQAAYYQENKDKIRARVKKYRLENIEKTTRAARNSRYKKEYGITLSDYESMLSAQNHRCAICDRLSPYGRLHVDHNHKTGESRGLLCFDCNSGLGKFGDDVGVLRDAIKYLELYELQGMVK